jgi:hypothetical protein
MTVAYDGIDKKLKVFNEGGTEVFVCEARNDSVAPNAWRSDAGCPPGTYVVEQPEKNDIHVPSTEENDWIGEGRYFVPLTGIPGHDGIGIHGGGTGTADPLAPRQGWVPTLNCIRLQNEDLQTFAQLMYECAPCAMRVVQAP